MSGALVVNADDLGVSKGATIGVLRAHREGVVTSASLCVTTPFYGHALETCVRACPELGIGLHFSLTVGSPASELGRVPLLVDGHGRFRWRFGSLFVALTVQRRDDLLEQVNHEIDAQFARLAEDGIQADHVDGERHVHLIPGVFESIASAARRHGVRFVRAGRDRGPELLRASDIPALAVGGGFTKYALLSQLASRARALLPPGLSSADHVVSYLYTGRMNVVLTDLLAREPSGITEVMLHPGVPRENGALDLGNRAMERYLHSRHRELELEASIAARSQRTAWRLTSYRQLAEQVQ